MNATLNIITAILILTLTTLSHASSQSHSNLLCSQIFFKGSSSLSTPLFKNLLKNPIQNRFHKDELSDLSETPNFKLMSDKKVFSNSSEVERLMMVSNLLIKDIMAAPGHRLLRNPKQVEKLAEYIESSSGGNFQHDPILINIVTKQDGTIRTIDLWNAHHRLVAYLKAGYQYLNQIPTQNFKILVNGVVVGGQKWGHFLSVGALDPNKTVDYSIVPVGGDIRVGTVSVDGMLTNFELGSRNTIGKLYQNTFHIKQPKIGVYFGTFDPVHEGHIHAVTQALKQFGLDEVVIIANPTPMHKPGATSLETRINMLKLRLSKEDQINLYVGDSKAIIDKFGRDPLIEQLSQIYGTKNIFQVIGTDSFEKLKKEDKIKSSQVNFIVMPRSIEEVIDISEVERDHVFLGSADLFGLSSTMIRERIKSKSAEKLTSAEIHSEVLRYILSNELYLADH